MGPTGELAWLVTALVVGLLVLLGGAGACVELGRRLVLPHLERERERVADLGARLVEAQAQAGVSAGGRRRQHDADGAVDRVAGVDGDPGRVLDGLRGLLPPGDPGPPPAPPAAA